MKFDPRRLASIAIAMLAVAATATVASAQQERFQSGLGSATFAPPSIKAATPTDDTSVPPLGADESAQAYYTSDRTLQNHIDTPTANSEKVDLLDYPAVANSDSFSLTGYGCDNYGCDLSGDCCSSGACEASCGCDPCGSSCCGGPCAAWWAHRSKVFGEFLYLHPGDADVTHAQQQNGLGGAGTVPFGTIGRADPGFRPGFRVGGALCLSNCSSLFASYSFFESNAIGTVVPPAIGGGAVGSLVHHPGAAITASNGPVNSSYDINFQLADFGIRRVWRANNCYAINWRLGARYGHLQQDFLQSGVFSGGSAGRINTATNVDFDGGGLRIGLDGERRFGSRGFSIYGNVNASPMIGTVQADYTMTNVTTNVLLANAVWKDDRFITVLDYEAGLAWTGPCRKWRVSTGWNAAHWFNAVTTDSFINGVQNNNYVNINGALSFSGLVARIERRF